MVGTSTVCIGRSAQVVPDKRLFAFARSSGDRWNGVDWFENPEGSPVIAGTLLSLECRIYAEHEAGDHLIVLGEVLRLADGHGQVLASPLIYYKGRYCQLA